MRLAIRRILVLPIGWTADVESHLDVPWRDFLGAWGDVRAADILQRDDGGHYLVPQDARLPA